MQLPDLQFWREVLIAGSDRLGRPVVYAGWKLFLRKLNI
jgi:hypothetical protein